MSLASQITSLAGRIATEIKAVRAELASGLSGKASTSHTHTLDNLSDVVITAPSTGQAVVYDGTNFVNGAVSAAVADGSITDAKITASGLSPSKITGTAVITTDSRLSNSRTPTSHASTHAAAGSDPLTLAQSQVTNLTTDLASKAPAGTSGTGFPASPVIGQIFVNSTTKCIYAYSGSAWEELSRPNSIEPLLLIGI